MRIPEDARRSTEARVLEEQILTRAARVSFEGSRSYLRIGGCRYLGPRNLLAKITPCLALGL